MKKILKEWRSFVNEASKEPYPTSYAAQTEAFFKKLKNNSNLDAEQVRRLQAGYYIIAALRGSSPKINGDTFEDFMKIDVNKKITKDVLRKLIKTSERYDDRLEYGEDAERGKKIKETDEDAVLYPNEFTFYTTGTLGNYKAYVVEMPNVKGNTKASFPYEGDITEALIIVRDMIENNDFNFNLFDPGTDSVPLAPNKPTRGAGLGASGITVPGGMSEEEYEEFEKQVRLLLQYDKYIKSALLPDEGPKPFLSAAPIPRDYYHKQAEMLKKTAPAYRWIADAWERAIPRMTDKISRKHAEREAQAFANSAAIFEKRAEELANEISDPENLYNRFANVLRKRIPAMEDELERDEYRFAELEKKIRDNKYEEDEWNAHKTLKDSIPSLKKRLERTKKELSDMEKTHRSLKTHDVEPWSTVEPLIKAAREGDKQAAMTASKILRALGRKEEAREMRNIAMDRG
jgi:hypothetical protein